MPNIDEWKFSLDVAWDDPWYRWQATATLFVALAGSALFLWKMIPEGLRTGLLVLHYNLYVGIDDVRPWPWILLLPLILLCVVGGNLLAAGFLFRRDRVASRVMLCGASLFAALSLTGAFFLTLVNI